MELILAHQTETQISVTCDGQLSHSFDLHPLLLKDEKILIDNHVPYSQKLYEALFPLDTFAQRALALMLKASPGRILLVTTDGDLKSIPWEYTYGPDGFLVLECPYVRGLPAEKRIVSPAL